MWKKSGIRKSVILTEGKDLGYAQVRFFIPLRSIQNDKLSLEIPMKPYEELTHLGRLRRMRQLATAALDAYGLAGAPLKFVGKAGSTMYCIYAPASDRQDDGLFEPGQYMLRIYQPGYQAPEAIELELAWLAAMRREADLPVPEPLPALDGRLLTAVSMPGIPGQRNCSILRWLKGRLISQGIGPHHYRAQGRLMARLHNHAADWQFSLNASKRNATPVPVSSES